MKGETYDDIDVLLLRLDLQLLPEVEPHLRPRTFHLDLNQDDVARVR